MNIFNKKIATFMIIIFSIFAVALASSYAYFSTRITGTDNASNIDLKTALAELIFVDGEAVNLTNITPGGTANKTFYIENNSNSSQDYSLIWTSVSNGFGDKSLLTYSIACVGYSDYVAKTISSTPCTGLTSTISPSSSLSDVVIIPMNQIPSQEVQEYTVTFTVDALLPVDAIVSFSGAFGIGDPVNKIYGVTFNNATVGTRTDAAVGLSYTINSSTIDSDFDTADIYKDITEETDSYGNVFVKIPKFYIKKTKTAGNVWTYQITKDTQDSSYYLPECFKNQSTEDILDYVLIGKYNASLNGTKLESKTGFLPLVNQTINTFRTYARNNGASYQLIDIHVIDIIQTLFYVEFATLNSQSIMFGYSDYNPSAIVSGTTNSVLTPSGSPVSNSDGNHAMKYRGIENIYGNVFQFIDGINIDHYQTYIAKNPTNYASDVFTGEYVPVGYVNANISSQYILEMGFDSNYPFANYPISTTSTSTNSIYKDRYFTNMWNRISLFGGMWSESYTTGISYWDFGQPSHITFNYAGSRLVKKAF